MKKILISFLLIAMTTGCVQTPSETDKPEEPPVVEQPEKPVEQDKPKEIKYIEKIDETKDWVYIKEQEVVTKNDLELNPVLNQMNYYVFLDWLTLPFDDAPKKEKLIVNINAESVSAINEDFEAGYKDPVNFIYEFKWFINDAMITIVNKYGSLAPHMLPIFLEAYHIDLKSGELMSNDDLLSVYGLTSSDVQNIVNEYISETKLPDDDSFIVKQQLLLGKEYTTKYSNKSLLIVDNNDLYYIIGYYSKAMSGNIVFQKIKLN
ncbi:hypothetical protein [Dielma fastidiosa]|uniref:hypothetical protein n=1 Tax=Dielma fastidiosa TaxID=1034346 RepID=UPI000E4920EC|nr:hypothetical protein [Dielma fastidiosa]RHN00245.1 hypothetical protein DWZ33_10665 [Dielma fastidiosa]